MTLKQITCHIVVCDGDACDAQLSKGDYNPHYSHPGDELDDLEGEEWGHADGKHYCSGCAVKPHDFVSDGHWCDRCYSNRDSHAEQADAEAVRRG